MTDQTPYQRVGANLVELGISAIPIFPGQKRPGAYINGKWVGMPDWQNYSTRPPNEMEVEEWLTWPDAGVCVVLGPASNMIALDLDYGDDAIFEALESVMPPSPVKKKGAKGYTAFYRGTNLDSYSIKVGGKPVIEILSKGRQSVIPPTLHPEGMEYKWITPDSLEGFDVDDLPELPVNFLEQIHKVLTPFQTEQDRTPTGTSAEIGNRDTIYGVANDKAIANLDSWVVQLLPGAKRHGAGYRLAAFWHGAENPNVSIHPNGITDWGQSENFTPLDLIMKANSIELDRAFELLAPLLNLPVFDPSQLIAGQPIEIPEPYAPPPLTIEVENTSSFDQRMLDARNGKLAMRASGLVEKITRYINDTAVYTQPTIAMGATITALGALVGRNFKSGRYGGRANLLSLGVAYSGAGKNHPPETWKSLLVEAGVHTTHLGGSKLVSGAGVLSAMQEHPSRIYLLDEFGMLWQQIANSKASGGHKAEIVDLLTQLYSSAGSMWNGTDRASRDEKDGPRDLICNPHLCLYGSATPESLFAGMSSMNAVDGSLARFLVFEGVKGLPQKNKASERRSTVDRVGIIERLVDLANPDRYHDVMLNSTAAQPASPIDVPWNDDATDYFDKADEWIDDLRRDNMGGIRQAFLARVMENAERIALIGAVCDHMPEPKVTLANAEWALHLAFNCCYNLISQLDDHLSDNEIEGKSKRLLKVIKDAGANGITKSLLVSRAQWIKARERNDLLADLQESGMVVAVQIEGTGSKPATTFTHAEYLING